MSESKKYRINKGKEETDALDDLLGELGLNEGSLDNHALQRNSTELPDIKKSGYMDFTKIQREAERLAKERITSITDFYLDDRLLSERYVKVKMRSDRMTVAKMFFQLKTAEHAIIKLLEDIDAGNIHPRQFEVLASLQRSMAELTKNLASIEIVFENNYKTIRMEWDAKLEAEKQKAQDGYVIQEGPHPALPPVEDDTTMIRSRGTRQILKALHQGGKLRNEGELADETAFEDA